MARNFLKTHYDLRESKAADSVDIQAIFGLEGLPFRNVRKYLIDTKDDTQSTK